MGPKWKSIKYGGRNHGYSMKWSRVPSKSSTTKSFDEVKMDVLSIWILPLHFFKEYKIVKINKWVWGVQEIWFKDEGAS